jgi:hypothetical protein
MQSSVKRASQLGTFDPSTWDRGHTGRAFGTMRETGPSALPKEFVHCESVVVDMYTEFLETAMREWSGPNQLPELLKMTRRRRADLSTSHTSQRDVCDALATEVRYDCALVMLCRVVGIPTPQQPIASPKDERHRLEVALSEHGFSVSPSTSRPASPDTVHTMDVTGPHG